MKKIIIHTDGGSRGNPGPAGIGAVIQMIDQINSVNLINLINLSKYIGEATNNVAEYKAVLEALIWVKENLGFEEIEINFFLDSQLVVEQLKGNYKMKNEGLKPLFWEIREMVMLIKGGVTFIHVRREQNKEADVLVNKALDDFLKK